LLHSQKHRISEVVFPDDNTLLVRRIAELELRDWKNEGRESKLGEKALVGHEK
jgi:hypothetical protein